MTNIINTERNPKISELKCTTVGIEAKNDNSAILYKSPESLFFPLVSIGVYKKREYIKGCNKHM